VLSPSFYKVGATDLMFPKDADAGSTMVVLKNNPTTAVL